MHEQHLRHQYLDILGVSSWISRGALPGAAPSAHWSENFVYDAALQNQLSEQAKPSHASNASTSEHEGSVEAAKSLSASLVNADLSRNAKQIAHEVVSHLPTVNPEDSNEQLVSERGLETKQRPNENASNSQPASSKELHQVNQDNAGSKPVHIPLGASSNREAPVMRLMFWQYEDVLVIDSLPTQNRGAMLPAKYEKLLTNLIKAMQYSTKRLNPQVAPYVLNWPTLAGVGIDQGWEQAVSAVQYKIAKIFQDYSPKLVLMLGENCPQMIMNMNDDFDQMRGVVFALRTHSKAIATYSLTQMLNVPDCKQEVWSDLQKVL